MRAARLVHKPTRPRPSPPALPHVERAESSPCPSQPRPPASARPATARSPRGGDRTVRSGTPVELAGKRQRHRRTSQRAAHDQRSHPQCQPLTVRISRRSANDPLPENAGEHAAELLGGRTESQAMKRSRPRPPHDRPTSRPQLCSAPTDSVGSTWRPSTMVRSAVRRFGDVCGGRLRQRPHAATVGVSSKEDPWVQSRSHARRPASPSARGCRWSRPPSIGLCSPGTQ